jgi:hypothetical protein
MTFHADRPVRTVLLMRAEWEREANVANMMRYPHTFAIVDVVAIETYQEMGYRVVALDPESELAWRVWQAAHPEPA